MNKGCHTCMIKHTMHVQSLHCSTYLTWLDVCIYVPRSHFHFSPCANKFILDFDIFPATSDSVQCISCSHCMYILGFSVTQV